MAKTGAQQPANMPQVSAELKSRLLFLLMAIFIYRIGTHIPVPGINPDLVAQLFRENEGTVLGMFNMFSGGAAERMSILALGIIPYISASIIMQILGAVNPTLEQLKKEGEAGRRKITQYTRYLTVGLAVIQSIAMVGSFSGQAYGGEATLSFMFVGCVSLVTGAVFMMWLGEQVTEYGIGNGISMMIFAGIVAGLPSAVGQMFQLSADGVLNPLLLIAVCVIAVAIVWLVVWIERGQRRITVNSARGQGPTASNHLPLKVNNAGVIPAIFASSILLFPGSILTWFGEDAQGWLKTVINGVKTAIDPGQPLHLILFAGMIIFFCFFYTALMFNPKDIADNLKRSGAFVPGIRPGEQTARYIDGVLTRLTVFGSIYIALVCLLPQFLVVALEIPFYLGGTSLLIVVVVIMDFVAQVQSHLMSQQYQSVMKKRGSTKNYGRSGVVR